MGNQKMRTNEAAEYIGLSRSTLAKMRVRGDGPPFAKAGSRIVVYDRPDLDAWIETRKRNSTDSTALAS